MPKDGVDDGIDVADVDLAVAVHISIHRQSVGTGMAVASAVDDDDNHRVGIGNVGFTVTVHVLRNDNDRIADDLEEFFPI